jgi:hypothetical protein
LNDTFQRIKALREAALATKQRATAQHLESLRRRGEAAVPLFDALEEVQDELVKVSVLRQIWPEDFHSRDEHARGLIESVLGDPQRPCGVRLHVPGGHKRFEVEILDDGSLAYVSARETLGGRPHVIAYASREQWLNALYATMASLLEI